MMPFRLAAILPSCSQHAAGPLPDAAQYLKADSPGAPSSGTCSPRSSVENGLRSCRWRCAHPRGGPGGPEGRWLRAGRAPPPLLLLAQMARCQCHLHAPGWPTSHSPRPVQVLSVKSKVGESTWAPGLAYRYSTPAEGPSGQPTPLLLLPTPPSLL